MPENLGKSTAKNAKRSQAVAVRRSKRPLHELNSKFDSVRPCSNESGLVCKHTQTSASTREQSSADCFVSRPTVKKLGKNLFLCEKQ